MNIILLFLWMIIALITGLCIYYNLLILDKYLESSTPRQFTPSKTCQYENIPSIDISKLEVYSTTSGITSYLYTVDNVKYIISPSEKIYSKVCSGFCTEGLAPTGSCKLPSNQSKFDICENLLKPIGTCLSSAKPLVTVENGSSKQNYYAFAPYTGS